MRAFKRRRLLPLLFVLGCGGVGVTAPHVMDPGEEREGCPGAGDLLAHSRQALDDGRLDELRPVLRRVLFDDGGMRVALPVLRKTARRLPPGDALAIADGYAEGHGLARLMPHLVEVLTYVTGTSAYVEGEHYDSLDALGRILARCDTAETLPALRRVLSLEVADGEGQSAVWLEEAFDALIAVVNDPVFVALLEDIRFDDAEGEGGSTAVGRDAFVLVVQLVSQNVASPDFDAAFVRGLLEDLLIQQLPDEAEARDKVRAFLDLLDIVLDPETGVFDDVQTLLHCSNRQDRDGHIPGLLFDYLSIEELSLPGFLADLDAMGKDPAGQALRLALIEAADVLEEEPRLTRDFTLVLARFLEPDTSRAVVPAVLGLRGSGVLTEALAFLGALLDGPCP